MHGYLNEHKGTFDPDEIRTLQLHSRKRGNPFGPAEPSLKRGLTLRLHERFLPNILLMPLSKASLTNVGYATALLWHGLNQICEAQRTSPTGRNIKPEARPRRIANAARPRRRDD